MEKIILKAQAAAEEANRQGMRIITIGLGTEKGDYSFEEERNCAELSTG
jgi:hypothetical protein